MFTPKHIKLFIMMLACIVGVWLLFVGYEATQKVTQYQLNNNSVTIIDLKEKNTVFNLPLVAGFILSAFALVLAIDLFFWNKKADTEQASQPMLTEQEKIVVSYMKQGMTNKEIAHELSISLSTVKSHINNIYKKLHIRSRAELLKLS